MLRKGYTSCCCSRWLCSWGTALFCTRKNEYRKKKSQAYKNLRLHS